MTEFHLSKSDLPKGWSYPVNRSEVAAALVQVGVQQMGTVRLLLAQGSGQRDREQFWETRILQARWSPEPQHDHPDGAATLDILAVPSDRRRAVREALLTDGLPAASVWIRDAYSASDGWRSTAHHFIWSVHRDASTLDEEQH